MEFRKFMYLTGIEISRIRRGPEGYAPLKPIAFDDGQHFVGYDSPLNAPPYIDRVWRALITYDRQYRLACHQIARGYIFRTEPK